MINVVQRSSTSSTQGSGAEESQFLGDQRSGWPAVVAFSIRDSVKDMVYKNRTTVRVFADEHGDQSSTVHGVLIDELGMSKVSARWRPRLLTDMEKECLVHCSQMFLSRFDAEGDQFLYRIITTGETWLHHFDPETKARLHP